jgi:antitoxin HicB
MSRLSYPVVVQPLKDEDGGGFIATVPDSPGCLSDGETPQEALANVDDATKAWIEADSEATPTLTLPQTFIQLQVRSGS